MAQHFSPRNSRLHPTRHLLYAFGIGALLTSVGFMLARQDAANRSASAKSATLVIAGSETLRPMMSRCAESFMSRNPDAHLVVRGGGSSTGIAALLVGQIDLALTSRELAQSEMQATPSSGAATSRAVRAVPIAREGVAVIAHPAVGIEELSMEQLAALLAGDIGDWSALGLKPSGVVVVGRAPGSGTAVVIHERVLGTRALSASAQLRETHDEVIAAVSSTPGAIGYADAPLAANHKDDVKTLRIRAASGDRASLPERDAIAKGEYPLSRTLYLASVAPTAATLAAFIEFCTGEGGRPFIEEAGFLPIATPR